MFSNKDSLRSAADTCLVTGILLLLLHVYFYYYPVFSGMGWESPISNRVLELIIKTGLFDRAWFSKNLALLLFLFSSWGGPVRQIPETSLRLSWGVFLSGLFFYLVDMPGTENWALLEKRDLNMYVIFTTLSTLAILFGATWLRRQLKLPWPADDPFGWLKTGFPQERRQLHSEFALHLRAAYLRKSKTFKSWINLINPRRGVMIIGTPGAGKSWFIIEPLIQQIIKKRMALFIYDFKYPALTKWAYYNFMAAQHRYPPSTRFYCINFTDLSRSHRCNVLQPTTLTNLTDAIGASKTILLSMNKTWAQKQGEFFVESPVNFVAALIWYLRKYQNGQYCTLPHVVELASQPYKDLFPILANEPEIATLIDPFVQAYENNSMEMLDGQVSSAKISLSRLSSPKLYYLLTGDDFTLDINNPAAPKIFCLGGDPEHAEALAPIISLYIDRLTRICNQPKQHPCALVCDEFATIRAYSMATTMATGRSNNIIPILAIQDISQLRTLYSQQEADTMLNISGNLLCGQASGETARWVSDRFPKILQDRPSVSINSTDTSISTTQFWEPSITPSTISSLSSGEFVGITADDPSQKLKLKTFHARILRQLRAHSQDDLPEIAQVNNTTFDKAFKKVKVDIAALIAAETIRARNNTSA